jgi:hypothetical protein
VNVKRNRLCIAAAAFFLGVMAILMVSVSRQDSATVDETTFLGSGYSFWQGYRYYLVADHPPLGQMLASLPLLAMNIRLSDNAKALLEKQVGYPWTLSWRCEMQPVQSVFPQGRDNWYFWAMPEGQLFGQIFVYDGSNDGDAMMFHARLVQVTLTLFAGIFIFWWTRRLAGLEAAVLALTMWVANPLALGYGHLIITDVGAMLMIPVAVFAFGRFLEQPGWRTAAWAGAATACALALKYTALVLGPIFVALTALYYLKHRPKSNHWRAVFEMGCGLYWPAGRRCWSPTSLNGRCRHQLVMGKRNFSACRDGFSPSDHC